MPKKPVRKAKDPIIQTSLYIPETLLNEVKEMRKKLGYTKDHSFFMDAIKEKLAREKRKK